MISFFFTRARKFRSREYKNSFLLEKYKKSFLLRKYKNLFNTWARKFHFQKGNFFKEFKELKDFFRVVPFFSFFKFGMGSAPDSSFIYYCHFPLFFFNFSSELAWLASFSFLIKKAIPHSRLFFIFRIFLHF